MSYLSISGAICLVVVLASSAWAQLQPFVMGILLVGPNNDQGWSQAHYEGSKYVEQKLPDVQVIYQDMVNPINRPGVTILQLVDDMAAKKARIIIATAHDMKDGIREAAKKYPEIIFIQVAGDDVLTGNAPKNLGNVMGRMEYGKMLAGFAAAMTTKTGKIGYVGPLSNDETRRLANATFLGAQYAWTKVRGKPASELKFAVHWIGFWYNIAGVTLDPSQVTAKFFDTGTDVVISGIYTTEVNQVASQKRKAGAEVWVVPYNDKNACEGFEQICLGVPYFNWGPAYLALVTAAKAGTWEQTWDWNGPNWQDLNNPDLSAVGFKLGAALAAPDKAKLDTFAHAMGSKQVTLFSGPLAWQNGAIFLKDGTKATDKEIWYSPQLLEGMHGPSLTN